MSSVKSFLSTYLIQLRPERKSCLKGFLKEPFIENTCELMMVEVQIAALDLLICQSAQVGDVDDETLLSILSGSIMKDIENVKVSIGHWCQNPISTLPQSYGTKLRTLLVAKSILDGVEMSINQNRKERKERHV